MGANLGGDAGAQTRTSLYHLPSSSLTCWRIRADSLRADEQARVTARIDLVAVLCFAHQRKAGLLAHNAAAPLAGDVPSFSRATKSVHRLARMGRAGACAPQRTCAAAAAPLDVALGEESAASRNFGSGRTAARAADGGISIFSAWGSGVCSSRTCRGLHLCRALLAASATCNTALAACLSSLPSCLLR